MCGLIGLAVFTFYPSERSRTKHSLAKVCGAAANGLFLLWSDAVKWPAFLNELPAK
jgi:hypothetical protein